MPKTMAWLVYALTGVFFLCFFLWPIGTTAGGAFFNADGHFTLEYLREVFRNPIYVEGLRNAFLLGISSTIAAAMISVPLAVMADRFDFTGKKIVTGMLLLPMILPPFVGAIGIRQLLGQYGAVNALLTRIGLLASDQTIDWLGHGRFFGIVLLNALHLYPILFLNATAALANIDPSMSEAAENLGCTGWRKFRRITLPLMMPGLFAGGAIVFIFAFTELGVPLMFDYSKVTPVQIFMGIKEIAGNPFPFALVVVMLVTTSLLYFASRFVFGRQEHAGTSKATVLASPQTPSKGIQMICLLSFGSVIFFALMPHVAVILVSIAKEWYHTILPGEWTMEHYRSGLGHPLAVPAILNSLKYASLSTAFDLVFGLAIAWVSVRTNLPGRSWLDTLAMLPLAVPGLVLAFGYVSMTQDGKWFSWLNPSRDPTLLLIIAYAIRRLPYVVRSAVAGLQQTSRTFEEAAYNLGCPPIRTTFRITLPLISSNILAGALLAFSFAMLEVSDSLILSQQRQSFPITKAIYELSQLIGEGRFVASALGVWAMIFLGITILATNRMLGKRLGALFRI